MASSENRREDSAGRMQYVGFCRVCGAGAIGVRLCGRCGDLSLVCDECGALWTDARLSGPPSMHLVDEAPCPSCGHSLWEAPSGWATRGQVFAMGWLARAIEDGVVTLREGGAFGPGG